MDRNLLIGKLSEQFDDSHLYVDEPMSGHTTFGIGGPVDAFVSVSSVDDIESAIEAARVSQAPWRVMGCGSNLLIADTGLEGLVIHLGEDFAAITSEGSRITAQAGATNAQVSDKACELGLSGYEFASGIPGSIGGAAIMNAGAYEGEFADVCESVACLTLDGEIVEVPAADAQWRYRHSMMSDKGWIVLGATLQLVPFDAGKIRAKVDDLTERRAAKQPLEYGSAGSAFKRPPGYFAGKLIDDAGMRGHMRGGAQVSEKHCGFVINKDRATAADVRAVIADVQRAVLADAGVTLECEMRMWGFDD